MLTGSCPDFATHDNGTDVFLTGQAAFFYLLFQKTQLFCIEADWYHMVPFSHPDIDNFLFKAIQCHFETIILTNALLLNKQRIDMIKKGHIQLGISLDGMTSDTHDFIRGKGAFDKLIRILKILSLEDIKFSITCTINKKNLCQIDEIIDYSLNELGAQTLFLNRLRPMGRMNQNTNIVLSEQENDSVYKLYLNQKGKYNKRIILADDSALKSNSHDNKIVCAAGNSLIAIDENFNVYPCIYGIDNPEYKMGNLIDQNLDVIWKSSKWNIFRGNLTLEDLTDCRNCKLHAVCVMKNCRLKPVYEGRSFTSSISYCNK